MEAGGLADLYNCLTRGRGWLADLIFFPRRGDSEIYFFHFTRGRQRFGLESPHFWLTSCEQPLKAIQVWTL